MSHRNEVVKKIIETEESTPFVVCDAGCGAKKENPETFSKPGDLVGWVVFVRIRSEPDAFLFQQHLCPKCSDAILPKEAKQ